MFSAVMGNPKRLHFGYLLDPFWNHARLWLEFAPATGKSFLKPFRSIELFENSSISWKSAAPLPLPAAPNIVSCPLRHSHPLV